MKDKEYLQRELAICLVCGKICTKDSHRKKVSEIISNKKKRDDFFNRLKKNEKQSTL